MIKPTVGRVLWYRPSPHDPGPWPGEQPLAAHVAHVNPEGRVNLMVIDANGNGYSRTGVHLVQEGEPVPNRPYAEWMPFQKGQAAKTEAAEAKLAGATS